LDRNSSGFVEESELALHLRRANIPDIEEGVITPQAKAKELIQLIGTPMNGTTTPEGNISVEQMVDFYLTRSLETIMNDEEFKTMVLAEWGMDVSDGMAMQPLMGREISRDFMATPPIVGKQVSKDFSRDFMATPPIVGKQISKDFPVAAVVGQHVNPVVPAVPASSNINASPRKAGINTLTSKAPPALNVDAEQYGEQYKQQYQNLTSPARRTSTVDAPNDQVSSHMAQKDVQIALASSYRVPAVPGKISRDIPASIIQAVSSAVTTQRGDTPSIQHTIGNSDAMITNNLNMLVASLQSKISDMQQTIDSQSQIISTQQQMLNQLQFVIQAQQQLQK